MSWFPYYFPKMTGEVLFFFSSIIMNWLIYYSYWYSLDNRSLLSLASKSFDNKFVVFGSFLAFYDDEIFQAHFVRFLLQIENQYFLSSSLVFLSETGI